MVAAALQSASLLLSSPDALTERSFLAAKKTRMVALSSLNPFTSTDARNGVPCMQSVFGNNRDGFMASQGSSAAPRRRRCGPPEALSAGNSTIASRMDGEEVLQRRRQMLEEEIERRDFKMQEVDKGGHQNWHSAVVTKVQDLAPGVRNIVVETECSREMVALNNAYTFPGQLAQVKVNGGEVVKVTVSSSPFSMELNDRVLYKIRGDITAGTTKQAQYFLSVKAPLQLLVHQADTPAVFDLKKGDELEVGPFDNSGLDLRPVMFLTRFPTLLFFASGKGIAVAKSIIEAKDGDIGSLNLRMREDVRLYYWSPTPSVVLYKDLFDKWEKKVKVCTAVGNTAGEEWNSHVGSFTSMWDEDDIEYDPDTTGVVVCTDKESRVELEKLLADAGISEKQIVTWEV